MLALESLFMSPAGSELDALNSTMKRMTRPLLWPALPSAPTRLTPALSHSPFTAPLLQRRPALGGGGEGGSSGITEVMQGLHHIFTIIRKRSKAEAQVFCWVRLPTRPRIKLRRIQARSTQIWPSSFLPHQTWDYSWRTALLYILQCLKHLLFAFYNFPVQHFMENEF